MVHAVSETRNKDGVLIIVLARTCSSCTVATGGTQLTSWHHPPLTPRAVRSDATGLSCFCAVLQTVGLSPFTASADDDELRETRITQGAILIYSW